MSIAHYQATRSAAELNERVRRGKVYQKVTEKGLKLYLLHGDEITVNPLIGGAHEPHIKSFIDHCAQAGFGGFLIDIGANIGLISCQSGGNFHEVHMFEPNPDCFAIMKVNAKLALQGRNYTLHDYGLGVGDKTTLLNVPLGNKGGAFIHDADNSYSDDVLAQKDRHTVIDPANYDRIEIKVKDGAEILGRIFQQLRERGLHSGVIKIDVEGYEQTILKSIAKSFPSDMHCVIIFESWDQSLKTEDLQQIFGEKMASFKLNRAPSHHSTITRHLSKWFKRFAPDESCRLAPLQNSDARGDIVLVVN